MLWGKELNQKHASRFSSECITIHVRITDFMDILLLCMYQNGEYFMSLHFTL